MKIEGGHLILRDMYVKVYYPVIYTRIRIKERKNHRIPLRYENKFITSKA